ncbi:MULTISPECIES: aldo/keto reductase [Tissierellales]|jgi:predicted oxidoreductase|uniref:Oxidoreductase n=1 Tax=Acidilutibacter cellobiosedens TaxID=2507161 RepID=A0A410QBY5_9FIRM|nr:MULTISPECIES: aldo/keto reductase [Tissierellales]MBE6083663.1 oxidoreductase [Tissierellaceae bacterium]QAT61497.1 oxidoreductase [Acidilutibacter cellobiosedens]SCL83723.1 Oxidoreductase YdhF [Sporanaerobacter sp. PP17-6a]
MEYIKMADNLYFSRIALGFWRLLDWNLTDDELIRFLEECLDLGITTMDHADIYGNYMVEKKFGDALKKRPDLRKKMQIITKCGIVYKSAAARVKYYDYSEKYIIQQVEKSLKYMGTDYIDTLLLHRPSPFMDPKEIGKAFEKLYKDGKVKSFGVSNFLPDEFRMLKSYLTVPLITDQVELSALNMGNMENGVINLCLEERIHPMIWSPLAGGRIFTGTEEQEIRLRETLEIIREEVGASSIDEIAFAWLLSHPAQLIPITGSGEIGLVKKPVSALKYKLTPEEWFMIWTAVKGHKVP